MWFLRLASLAARQRSACLGYDISSTSGYSVKFFRRNVSVPVLRNDQDDVLIDQRYFESFLKTAYDSLLKLDSAGHLVPGGCAGWSDKEFGLRAPARVRAWRTDSRAGSGPL